MVHRCQWNKYKINTKYFFSSKNLKTKNNISINKKKKQNGAQKNKIENVYWSITAKMTTSAQFPIKEFFGTSQKEEDPESASDV